MTFQGSLKSPATSRQRALRNPVTRKPTAVVKILGTSGITTATLIAMSAAALLLPGAAWSEGSRSLFPTGYVGGRAPLNLVNDATAATVVRNRAFIYVYAQSGEYILSGSSNRDGEGRGNIQIYDPQNFGLRGNEAVPAAGSFNCNTGAVATDPLSNFDAPGLPIGWSTFNLAGTNVWARTANDAQGGSTGKAAVTTPNTVSDALLIAPPLIVGAGTPRTLSFFQSHDMENGNFDGTVLEISINGGAFQDVLAAGGSFTTGGYTGTIVAPTNPLNGRQAWASNSSGGYVPQTYNLAGTGVSAGDRVQFRWRFGSDASVASAHMRLDTITAVNLTAPGVAAGPHYNGNAIGRIQTRAAELAGPRSADNANGAGSAWTPCAYRAPVTGLYGLVFTGSTNGAGDVTIDNIATAPEVLQNQAAAWDITVRSNATSTTDINGRVYSHAWVARTAGNGPTRRLNHTLYYVTQDGYRYSQRLNDLDPFSYSLYANRAGFLDAGAPLYRGVRGNNFNVTTINPGSPGSGVTAQAAEYPVFLSDVSDAGPNDAQVELVLSALGIPSTPPVPQLNSVVFSGSVAGNTTGLGIGGTFTFNTVNTLTYQIVVAGNPVTPNFDPAISTNRVISGVALTGTHNVVWDGLDNAGNAIPVGNGYSYRVEGRNGEVHFPLVDTEGMIGGGPTITKLNGATPGDTTVYYDDRGYRTSNNTLIGIEDGHICGAGSDQVQPSPNQALAGISSSSIYRNYASNADSNSDCADADVAFGSAKVLDTWALERTPVTEGELNIVPLASEIFLTLVKTGVAGPIDLEVTNTTTYTLTVTNSGDDPTSGNVVINDNLRDGLSLTGFSGANWNCVGPTSVVCTYSGPPLAANGGSTSVDITVSIAALTPDANNTGRVSGGGDPVCLPPPAVLTPVNAERCTSSVTIGTVPVTLSYVNSAVVNGILRVEFITLAEAGTAGFRILAGNPTTQTRAALSTILPSKGSSLGPQNYSYEAPYGGETAIWIEEVTSDASRLRYGPFSVGTRIGEHVAADEIDWNSIQSELDAFHSAQNAALRARGAGATLAAEISVSESGLVNIDYDDLVAQGIDWLGRDPKQVELMRGTELQPLRYVGPAAVGPGSSFTFLAKATEDSIYTTAAVYRLQVNLSGLELGSTRANPSGLGLVTTIRDWIVHAPNREYDLSSRAWDPYSAFRLFRGGNSTVSRVESFDLPNLDSESAILKDGTPPPRNIIEVDLWSDFDTTHSVRLLVNENQIATIGFSGRGARTVSSEVEPGVLVSGTNSLRVELVADTGQDLDSINLEEIRVNYPRRLVASDNRLTFSLPSEIFGAEISDSLFGDGFGDSGSPACQPLSACVAYEISGLTTPDLMIFRQRRDEITELTGATIIPNGGGFLLQFASDRQAGDRYWIEPRNRQGIAAINPVLPVSDPLSGGMAEYLIVSHGAFISGLSSFIAAREADGLSVRAVDVADIYRFYGSGEPDPYAIGDAVRAAAQRLGTRYVLLVGGDTRDYQNFGGSNSVSFIPTHYRTVGPVVTFAPTDVPFADLDGDGSMDIAIGRWPVRTMTELDNVIAKTLAYATADHSRKVVSFSDRNQHPVDFGTQLRLVPNGLGGTWSNSAIRLQDYAAPSSGTTAARNDLVSAVNAGQALMVFMGHGAPLAWTQEGLITSQLLINGLFSNFTRPTVAWAVGCYGTYFTQPAYNSVSHGLLTRTATGAAAVFGASTLTEIAHDIAWVNSLSYRIRGQRLGDALREVQNRLVVTGDSYRDIWLGVSLLGDPTLQLRDSP